MARDTLQFHKMLSNTRAALMHQMHRQEIDRAPALYTNEYHEITFLRS